MKHKKSFELIGEIVNHKDGLRFMPSGVAVLNTVVMVVSEQKKKGAVELVDEYFDIATFGETADQMNILQPGQKILAMGELRSRIYEDKNKAQRIAMELSARSIFPIIDIGSGSMESQG